MSNLTIRTEKTADGLRSKLFDTLDALIQDKISLETVEAVCAISDKIIASSKVELDIFRERERVAKELREDELKLLMHKDAVVEKLKGVIDVIPTS
jgi:hypothetical protein